MRLKLLIMIPLAMLAACSPEERLSSIPENTVMVTNLGSNSGGSGSIISSSAFVSKVLTNAHVCGVVKNGGLVHTSTSQAFVMSYQISNTHDLCVITVAADLHAEAKIADTVPQVLDFSTVAGHPHLMPIIITHGHFSGRQVVPVSVGVRDCTDEDRADPQTGMFCALFGKLPIIKNYEAVAVSNLIQPGSSGSAVYTAEGKIGAVIFAGEGDPSFGYAVPIEYIKEFLGSLSSIPSIPVNPILNLGSGSRSDKFSRDVWMACLDKETGPKIKHVCDWIRPSNIDFDLIERK